jgi:tetratricopeptide (TPR) repeat protein
MQQSVSNEQVNQTLKPFRDKLASNPNDHTTRLQLVQLLFNYQLYSEVVVEGEKALKAFPDRVGLYYQMGESYRQLRKFPEALRLLSKGYGLMKTPFSDFVASYALTLLRLGKTQEATPILKKALLDDPLFITKRIASGDAEYRSNDLEFAADEYLAVLILDRSKLNAEQTVFVKFNVDFKSYIESNDAAAATATFIDNVKRKLGDKLDYDELGAAFACMVASKQIDQARALYFETMKLNPSSANQDTLDKSFLSISYGLASECPDIVTKVRITFIRTIKSMYDLTDEEVKPIYALHEFIFKQGLVNAASEITTSLLNGGSGRQFKFVQLSNVFLRYQKTDEAIGTFAVMLKKKNFDKFGYGPDLLQMYTKLLKDQKNTEAQNLITQVNSINESDINSTYTRLSDIFTRAGDPDKSVVILQKLLTNDPTNTALSIKLGDAYFAKGRYDEIISAFVNVKTREGKKYLAAAYEKKYLLSEANKTWEDIRKMSNDPKDITEAKKHIDDNLIAMMNPDFAKLQAEANRPKAPTVKVEKVRIVIDTPKDGYETTSASVEVTGKVLGTLSLQDVKINGKSVGTPRGMKAVESQAQQTQAGDSLQGKGLPFTYIVALSAGKNEIKLEVVAEENQIAEAKVVITRSAEKSEKIMTIEEADGIRQSKAYAVIIGVGDYESPGIKKLNFSANDAMELANVLTDPTYGGFKKENVTVLVNKDATTRNIKKAIGSDLKRAPDDGLAIVFFAGHGAPEGDKTYWLTYDADPASLYASALSNDEVIDMLGRINTKRVVTFIDACYSGASVTSSKGTRAVLIEDPFKSFEGTGRIAVTSSDGREQSLEDEKLKHGIFTYRLIEAIKGKADFNGDGIVMADEIARYVKETVPNDARERSHKQEPKVIAEYTGYIPISRNPENVLKNSRLAQIQIFEKLYNEDKISAANYRKIKEIVNGSDDKPKKKIIDFLNKDLDLEDLIKFINR